MAKTNNTGTYIFDKKTGKIIKLSDDIPSLKKPKEHTCGGGCCCGGSCPND